MTSPGSSKAQPAVLLPMNDPGPRAHSPLWVRRGGERERGGLARHPFLPCDVVLGEWGSSRPAPGMASGPPSLWRDGTAAPCGSSSLGAPPPSLPPPPRREEHTIPILPGEGLGGAIFLFEFFIFPSSSMFRSCTFCLWSLPPSHSPPKKEFRNAITIRINM